MEANENLWTMRVVKREGFEQLCLEMSPDPLRVLKGKERSSRMVRIVADQANPVPVELVLENGPLDLYFGDADEDQRSIKLDPGGEASFCLKARLGLVQRRNPANRFTNTSSPWALVLKFDHPGLADCGHGTHTDMHIEC
jgi:hypothetical protein